MDKKIRTTDRKMRDFTPDELVAMTAYDEVYKISWDDLDLLYDVETKLKTTIARNSINKLKGVLQTLREDVHNLKIEIEEKATIE